MKTRNNILLLAIVTLLVASCKSTFKAEDFSSATQNHVYVAVLPVKVLYQGKELPENKLEEIELAKITDSKAFQQGMTAEILGSTRRGRRNITVKVIPTSTVLSKLKDAGIDPIQSWENDVQKMAKIVGADAVVTGQITKNQYFSDAASVGAEVGGLILREVTGGSILSGATNSIQNNKRVVASFELVNAADGGILWANSCASSFDWKHQHNDIVRHVSHRVARRFPYRK